MGDHRYPNVLTHSFPPRRSSCRLIRLQGTSPCRTEGRSPRNRGRLLFPCLTDQIADGVGFRGTAKHLVADHETRCSSDTKRLRELSVSLNQGGDLRRSEEHTSELQSLMRTSYAVSCLKKQ